MDEDVYTVSGKAIRGSEQHPLNLDGKLAEFQIHVLSDSVEIRQGEDLKCTLKPLNHPLREVGLVVSGRNCELYLTPV